MYYDDCAPSVDLFKTVYTLSSFHAFTEPRVESTADAEIVVPRLRWVTWPRLSKVPSAPVSRSSSTASRTEPFLTSACHRVHSASFFLSPLTENITRNELFLLLIFFFLNCALMMVVVVMVCACVSACVCVCVCEREYGAWARMRVCVLISNYFFYAKSTRTVKGSIVNQFKVDLGFLRGRGRERERLYSKQFDFILLLLYWPSRLP